MSVHAKIVPNLAQENEGSTTKYDPSPLGLVAFDAAATCHLILEGTEFLIVITT